MVDVNQFSRGWRRLADDAQPAERVDTLIRADRGDGLAADPVKTVAAAMKSHSISASTPSFAVTHARPLRVYVVETDCRRLVKGLAHPSCCVLPSDRG